MDFLYPHPSILPVPTSLLIIEFYVSSFYPFRDCFIIKYFFNLLKRLNGNHEGESGFTNGEHVIPERNGLEEVYTVVYVFDKKYFDKRGWKSRNKYVQLTKVYPFSYNVKIYRFHHGHDCNHKVLLDYHDKIHLLYLQTITILTNLERYRRAHMNSKSPEEMLLHLKTNINAGCSDLFPQVLLIQCHYNRKHIN